MPSCAIYGCPNYSRKTKDSGIRYYSFPKDKQLAQQWITACRRLDPINIYNGRICSKHFHSSAYIKSLKHELLKYLPKTTRDLKPDAMPTEFLPNKKQSLSSHKKRNPKQQEIENIKEEVFDDTEISEFQQETESDPLSVTPPEPSTSELYKLIEQLKIDNLNLKNQNEILQQNLASVNTELESMKAMLRNNSTGKVFILHPTYVSNK